MIEPIWWEEINGAIGRMTFFRGPEWLFHALRKLALFLDSWADSIRDIINRFTEEVIIADK